MVGGVFRDRGPRVGRTPDQSTDAHGRTRTHTDGHGRTRTDTDEHGRTRTPDQNTDGHGRTRTHTDAHGRRTRTRTDTDGHGRTRTPDQNTDEHGRTRTDTDRHGRARTGTDKERVLRSGVGREDRGKLWARAAGGEGTDRRRSNRRASEKPCRWGAKEYGGPHQYESPNHRRGWDSRIDGFGAATWAVGTGWMLAG